MSDTKALRELLAKANESWRPSIDLDAYHHRVAVASQDVIDALPAFLDELDSLRSRVVELEGALRPFVAIADERDERYRKRGGDPGMFPDGHPGYDISAAELRVGVFRRARTALTQGVRHDD